MSHPLVEHCPIDDEHRSAEQAYQYLVATSRERPDTIASTHDWLWYDTSPEVGRSADFHSVDQADDFIQHDVAAILTEPGLAYCFILEDGESTEWVFTFLPPSH